MRNKGQLTLFVIVGVFLILAVLLLFLFRGFAGDDELDKRVIDDVPTQLQPLQNFVDSCVATVATEGLQAIGEKGGRLSGVIVGDPTSSAGVEYLPGITVPYWHYMSSANTCDSCEFVLRIPPLTRDGSGTSFEDSLDTYIIEHLDRCLLDFNSFTSQGFIVERGDLTVRSVIRAESVDVRVQLPLSVARSGSKQELKEFFSSLPVNVHHLYSAAVNLTLTQVDQRFLEKSVLDLINVHAGLDSSKLPPMARTDFSSTPVVWVVTEVRENVMELIQSYMTILRIQGSKNSPVYELPKSLPYDALVRRVAQAVLDHMRLPLGGFEGLAVNFYYFEWPLYFDIPHTGGLVQPESSVSDIIPFVKAIPLHRYNTPYDISFPTVVEVRDSSAFTGEGMSLKFGLEANIRNNRAVESEVPGFTTASLDEPSLLCTRKNSGNVSVFVTSDSAPVPGVQVFYSSIDGCLIGETDTSGVLRSPFPVGIGQVKVRHPNLIGKSVSLKTEVGKDDTLRFELNALNAVTLNGVKRVGTEERALSTGESLLVSFTRVRSSGESSSQVASAVSLAVPGTVRLAKGRYMLQVTSHSENEVVYNPVRVCETVGTFRSEEVCEMIPPEPITTGLPSVTYEIEYTYTGADSLKIIGAFVDPSGSLMDDFVASESLPDTIVLQKEVYLP